VGTWWIVRMEERVVLGGDVDLVNAC
jgi:hypothetical protein